MAIATFCHIKQYSFIVTYITSNFCNYLHIGGFYRLAFRKIIAKSWQVSTTIDNPTVKRLSKQQKSIRRAPLQKKGFFLFAIFLNDRFFTLNIAFIQHVTRCFRWGFKLILFDIISLIPKFYQFFFSIQQTSKINLFLLDLLYNFLKILEIYEKLSIAKKLELFISIYYWLFWA